MADILKVIQDVINLDKQEKREHARIMREVQKKLREKEVDTTEDNADFMGAASQAAADGKKEFEFPPGSGKMYPVTIKDKNPSKLMLIQGEKVRTKKKMMTMKIWIQMNQVVKNLINSLIL